LLEHGQPIRFGAGGRKGLIVRDMEPVVVDVGRDSAAEREMLVHNAKAVSPALAELLAALSPPGFPIALGVFRDVERPVYDDLLTEQVQQAVQKRGRGNLAELLNAGTTWEVG
jgi:2-oxoglutarate ferredoxin oxidoreductase subunit beta